ncbi:MAG: SMC-Scp complex subunit ScpB [Saprospiraceae bacterium]|nr:SMC-Scp complex subunit ScpB [Saprospiraceae bacterium]
MSNSLATYLESLIFVADQPITRKQLRKSLEAHLDTAVRKEDIDSALEELTAKYASDDFAIEIVEIAGGFQFLTKPAYHPLVGSFLKLVTKKRLSRVALETLAIIAYKQPVSKSEIEKIRGVNCDYSVQKLLDKELIEITGRSDGPGRPLLYATSEKFMDYFGLRDLGDLPKLKDLQPTEHTIGDPGSVEEEVEQNLPDAVEDHMTQSESENGKPG